MLKNATPANATPLPIVLAFACATKEPALEIISARADWAAAIGRITADMAALKFRLPMPYHLHRVFEDMIRQEVAAELIALPLITEGERHQLEDIAWLAFDRRLSHHAATLHLRGRA